MKWQLFVLLLLLDNSICCMKRRADEITPSEAQLVKTYFEPTDINNALMQTLNNAKQQVLIAVYELIDQNVIDALVTLKHKGINVEVIIDEKTFEHYNVMSFISTFKNNNIILLVHPSKTLRGIKQLILHSKFIIIDETQVLTGSMNLTPSALGTSHNAQHNIENAIIIDSNSIAQEFIKNFKKIKKETLNHYVQILAQQDTPPAWLQDISNTILSDELKNITLSTINSFPVEQQIRLEKYTFVPRHLPSTQQNKILMKRGYTRDEINKMTAREAFRVIKNKEKPYANNNPR